MALALALVLLAILLFESLQIWAAVKRVGTDGGWRGAGNCVIRGVPYIYLLYVVLTGLRSYSRHSRTEKFIFSTR